MNLSLELEAGKRNIAYFSMEIGLDHRIPTYSGGLGILAGDTIKSAADLGVPMVAVTLLYRKGYFKQKLENNGSQKELSVEWDPNDLLTPLSNKVSVHLEGRTVWVKAWLYPVVSVNGTNVPVLFLDTDMPENSEADRGITHHLYGGDRRYRLMQEVILGIGGFRMLAELGFLNIKKFHMNEGHSALLTLELLRKQGWTMMKDVEAIRDACVFTTHTPVPAGHDQFEYDLVEKMIGDFVPINIIRSLGGADKLNMTMLALNLSKYVNGVAKKHGEISRQMFPGYIIEFITNGVHSFTWTYDSFKRLFDKYIPGWATDPFSLRYALAIPDEEIEAAHNEAKKALFDKIHKKTGVQLDTELLTIGFARRATGYKRADLIFSDLERLANISERVGKIQLVFAGKAHPHDEPGKELIRKIFNGISRLKGRVNCVYLEDYDMELASNIISGVDLWLNTPQRPNEASGTSGMKATHNGIPNFSILDGWWIEGHIEGNTGWSIGKIAVGDQDNLSDAQDMYEKLEKVIVPMFYKDRANWTGVMKKSIALNASFFNTHRMVLQYALDAYL
jgi:glycogen phosphorylase